MEKITVKVTVKASLEKAWQYWTMPEHITKWNFASADWHAPTAENDLRVGGKFISRMESKDGTMGFDFEGIYTTVEIHKFIEYVLEDDREVSIEFISIGNETEIVETFDAENENPIDMQRGGWQMILDNFKKYVEAN